MFDTNRYVEPIGIVGLIFQPWKLVAYNVQLEFCVFTLEFHTPNFKRSERF